MHNRKSQSVAIWKLKSVSLYEISWHYYHSVMYRTMAKTENCIWRYTLLKFLQSNYFQNLTWSMPPCHLQEAPGHGQAYGLNSHNSSWSGFSVCTKVPGQPDWLYLQGNITEEATFSMAKFRMLPRGPRHVGHIWSFWRHVWQTMWPLWHCIIGGKA